ncbi:probable inactive shikimate kinase like 1, chloroplastic isoform X3 [Corylus avellana]|uniref:probable inactive shikimate kinase like 1, chloroplastic isoform X3 n=1 Tax=Corylus avellana TaxID=13451 RepID=UPI00286D0A19|nr:probable inactive shikimate kinase like 1, chloroplastic isoform X3 [Corylus avellana]
MELTTFHSSCNGLRFRSPSLPFQAVPWNFIGLAQFPHSLSTCNRHKLVSTATSQSHNPSPKPLSTTCSVANDSSLNSTAKDAVVDPFLAVKVRFLIQKKAMDMSPELKGTSIFLVGMKNSMKTSLGKLLADALRDGLVEEAAGGESAAKSFKETDEKGFRESETEVLKQLSSMGRLVVCAGDGAVQSSTNLAFLRHGISIWIDIPLDMIARGMIEDQSGLSDSEIFASEAYSKVLTQLTNLYKEMRGGYAIADATISLQNVACQLGCDDLDAVTTENMTLEVLKEIEKLTRAKKLMEAAARPF